jgi:SAM-dependent methyltransferase
MNSTHDAFGMALLDTFHGKRGFAVIERDDGLVEVDEPLSRYLATVSHWMPCERRAIRRARGRVLDIGAGAGRHALHLQRKGLRVTALDPSPAAAQLLRERGLRDVRQKTLERLSPRDGRFDTIVMFGNNFGLLRSLRWARKLLCKMAQVTASDGQILAASTDPYRTTDPVHLAYHRRNRRRGRMGGQLRIRARYKHRATPWFDYLLASQEEVSRIVQGTGWCVAEVFTDGKAPFVVRLVKSDAGR